MPMNICWCYANKEIKREFNHIISYIFSIYLAVVFVKFSWHKQFQIKSDYVDRVCLNDYGDALM